VCTSEENIIMRERALLRRKSSKYLLIALAVMAVVAGYGLFGERESMATSPLKPSLPSGDDMIAAPSFTLTDIDGKSVSLSDFREKIVVLDFWATWCPPCKREIPDFIDLQKEYGQRGVQFVGIALDEPGRVQAFARQNGMNYPVLLGTNSIVSEYGGIEGIPTTFVIDKKGNVVTKFEGDRPRQVFEAEIKKLL
jgi:peroxiredoxin